MASSAPARFYAVSRTARGRRISVDGLQPPGYRRPPGGLHGDRRPSDLRGRGRSAGGVHDRVCVVPDAHARPVLAGRCRTARWSRGAGSPREGRARAAIQPAGHRDQPRALAGPDRAGRAPQARHRDYGTRFDNQHVHQRAESGPRGSPGGRGPGRRRGLRGTPARRHGPGGPQSRACGRRDSRLPRRRARPRLPRAGGEAPVLHAPRARDAPRRARRDDRRVARIGGHLGD